MQSRFMKTLALWGGAYLLAAGINGPVHAANFTAVPTAKAGGVYESNPRFTDDDEEDATGLQLEGWLDMQWASERTILSVEPRGRFWFYPDSDDDDLENEDLFLNNRLSHTTALSEYALDVDLSSVGVRNSEFESAGGESGSGSGRIVRADANRETIFISPQWSRLFGARNRIAASAGYTDVDFDKDISQTGLLPYEYWKGDLTYQRTLTQKTSVGILTDVTRFESKADVGEFENQSDTYGLSAFVDYAFSETLSGQLYGGWRNTDTEVTRSPIPLGGNLFVCPFSDGGLGPFNGSCTEQFSDDNFVGQATLRKASEITDYTLTVSRAISPNSQGAQTIRDNLDLVISRQLTQRLRGTVGILYFNQEDVGVDTARENDYVSARFNLVYRLTERWSLDSSYRFVNNDQDQINDTNRDVTNNYFYLGVRYNGKAWRR
jgi:hypothetical protein